jgi:lysophospholipase L1-like esterase
MGGWFERHWPAIDSCVLLSWKFVEFYTTVDVYARKLDVLNRGFSGYTTEWSIPIFKQVRLFYQKVYDAWWLIALQLITQNATAQRIRILTIWFGANDACVPPSPQHVPLPKFISNLKDMISLAKSSNSTSGNDTPETRILLISPPPVSTIEEVQIWRRVILLYSSIVSSM